MHMLVSIIKHWHFDEGLVYVYLGDGDKSLALVSFSLDSFVKVISDISIFHMILRMKFLKVKTSDSFEKTPLKVTGKAFYALTIDMRVIILEYLIISCLSRTFDLFTHL